jgi:hypothetical protein
MLDFVFLEFLNKAEQTVQEAVHSACKVSVGANSATSVWIPVITNSPSLFRSFLGIGISVFKMFAVTLDIKFLLAI